MHLRRTAALTALLAATACPEPEPAAPPCDSAGPGDICTWIGTGAAGFDGDGKALHESQLNEPADLSFDPNNDAYVADTLNHRVRKVTAQGTLQTLMGTGTRGDGSPSQTDSIAPNGAPASAVALDRPTDVTFLPDGSALVACFGNHKLRRLDPASGNAKVWAGSVKCSAKVECRDYQERGDGGPVREAVFDFPSRFARALSGDLWLVDQQAQRLRLIRADGSMITSPAGNGKVGFAGDGKLPSEASFHFDDAADPRPSGGLAFDAQGNLYVADALNHRVRRIQWPAQGQPRIETIAGTGAPGFGGDGGPALQAQLNAPGDVAVRDTTLYVADTGNHAVRAIDLATFDIRTVAGTGEEGFAGDGGPAASARLSRPAGVAVDTKGVLHIADTGNHRIRRVMPR